MDILMQIKVMNHFGIRVLQNGMLIKIEKVFQKCLIKPSHSDVQKIIYTLFVEMNRIILLLC